MTSYNYNCSTEFRRRTIEQGLFCKILQLTHSFLNGAMLAAVMFGSVRGFDSLHFLWVDALSFGKVEIFFFFFRFGTVAQPASMGTLDGFWFSCLLVERMIVVFSLAYWPGLARLLVSFRGVLGSFVVSR